MKTRGSHTPGFRFGEARASRSSMSRKAYHNRGQLVNMKLCITVINERFGMVSRLNRGAIFGKRKRYKQFRTHHWQSQNMVCSNLMSNGGEEGIWTLARFYPPTPLAGEPLIAAWVLLHIRAVTVYKSLVLWDARGQWGFFAYEHHCIMTDIVCQNKNIGDNHHSWQKGDSK